jgi:hypothetical protein
MINYSKKYGHFSALVEDYKPMHFKYLGYDHKERLPYFSVATRPLVTIRRQLKSLFRLELTYFDFRASMTPEQIKTGDMIFLTHNSRNHARYAENVSRVERLRCFLIKMYYLPELVHINGQLYNKHGKPTSKLPNDIEMYLMRWKYLMKVEPDFTELVHGMDPDQARDCVFRLLS